MNGLHLKMDCKSNYRIDDVPYIYDFLNNMPLQLGMKKLTAPYVISYDGDGAPEDRGITGNVIIAESHISIHTFPVKGVFFLDIFSCKSFDTKLAVDRVCREFQVEEFERWVTERGKTFLEYL